MAGRAEFSRFPLAACSSLPCAGVAIAALVAHACPRVVVKGVVGDWGSNCTTDCVCTAIYATTKIGCPAVIKIYPDLLGGECGGIKLYFINLAFEKVTYRSFTD